MPSRRPGLQEMWNRVFDSLEAIIPIYEKGSRRISLFADSSMREKAVAFAVRDHELVLDLGSGPGTMARLVIAKGGTAVLLDASRKMLKGALGRHMVQAVFEHLPFRDGAFESVVAGFSLRDSRDLGLALNEIRRSMKADGRFGFCDLGKPDGFAEAVLVGFYIRVAAPVLGAMTGGRAGLGFGSLYETYLLTLPNRLLSRSLNAYFSRVDLEAKDLGASIVVFCST
ncbi:MAG: methyltransferase domain-containing protein [Thaumarchaeota archaeon]|nr:methyltransferase domain-containing protein [Nitrososphaerota archaeon]